MGAEGSGDRDLADARFDDCLKAATLGVRSLHALIARSLAEAQSRYRALVGAAASSGFGMVFVRDVMTKIVIVIDPERTVLDAAKRMAAKKIGGLVVVKYGRPIGLVTDRDILWKVTSTGRNPSKVLVRDIMTSPVATVSPLTTLRAAARVMLEEETRWLVVTRLDKVEGIITASDLTQGFLEAFARATKRGIAPK